MYLSFISLFDLGNALFAVSIALNFTEVKSRGRRGKLGGLAKRIFRVLAQVMI